MQYTGLFIIFTKLNISLEKKSDIFNTFAHNIDCGDTFHSEAVLTSTHNPCIGAKTRQIGIPLHFPVLVLKLGYMGECITRTFTGDGKKI